LKRDPYENHLLDQNLPVTAKITVTGKISAVLHARAQERGLQLEPFPSRAVLKGEIHELILTEETAKPGSTVNCISYVCFLEIETAGVLWQGDIVSINKKIIGTIGGYDYAHMPNHMNIVLKSKVGDITGLELNLNPGDEIRFDFSLGKSL
jgi:hypothetical protein